MQQPSAGDPCKQFRDAAGEVDLGALIDEAIAVAGCAYDEARSLAGYQAASIAGHIAEALAHLHVSRVVHKGVTTSNR